LPLAEEREVQVVPALERLQEPLVPVRLALAEGEAELGQPPEWAAEPSAAALRREPSVEEPQQEQSVEAHLHP
jgi:hypothetical protein